MKINQIFNVFSLRNKESTFQTIKLSQSFRNKILLYCSEVFQNNSGKYFLKTHWPEFIQEMHTALLYRFGKLQLSTRNSNNKAEDIFQFLQECPDDQFLDFVEMIFKVECIAYVSIDKNIIVDEVNQFFISENLGYELTKFIEENSMMEAQGYPFMGRPIKTIIINTYPQIILKENSVIQTNIIKPALLLLTSPIYKYANKEFLEALEDYKMGDFGDCLTKCCSSFESVLKVICEKNHWKYKQTDSASTLVNIVVTQGGIEPFFEQLFIFIATLRNKLSKSHGAGISAKNVTKNQAQYSINITASAIVFLCNELG